MPGFNRTDIGLASAGASPTSTRRNISPCVTLTLKCNQSTYSNSKPPATTSWVGWRDYNCLALVLRIDIMAVWKFLDMNSSTPLPIPPLSSGHSSRPRTPCGITFCGVLHRPQRRIRYLCLDVGLLFLSLSNMFRHGNTVMQDPPAPGLSRHHRQLHSSS